MMKKLIFLALVSFFFVRVVSAQNPHINKADEKYVKATVSPEEICFSGAVAGNGNASSVSAYIIAEVTAKTLCFNPAGGAKEDEGVPGHQDYTFKGRKQTFNCRNGKADLKNVCADLKIVIKCPNPKWTGKLANVDVKNVTLVINGKSLDVTKFYR